MIVRRMGKWGRKMWRLASGFAFLVLLFSPTCKQNVRSGGQMSLKIYYFSMDAETLTPVTEENIQNRGMCVVLNDKIRIDKVLDILNSQFNVEVTADKFLCKRIRIEIYKVADGSQSLVAVVGSNGVYRTGNERYVQLDANSADNLKGLIEGLF